MASFAQTTMLDSAPSMPEPQQAVTVAMYPISFWPGSQPRRSTGAGDSGRGPVIDSVFDISPGDPIMSIKTDVPDRDKLQRAHISVFSTFQGCPGGPQGSFGWRFEGWAFHAWNAQANQGQPLTVVVGAGLVQFAATDGSKEQMNSIGVRSKVYIRAPRLGDRSKRPIYYHTPTHARESLDYEIDRFAESGHTTLIGLVGGDREIKELVAGDEGSANNLAKLTAAFDTAHRILLPVAPAPDHRAARAAINTYLEVVDTCAEHEYIALEDQLESKGRHRLLAALVMSTGLLLAEVGNPATRRGLAMHVVGEACRKQKEMQDRLAEIDSDRFVGISYGMPFQVAR
jgi:hypothetical protein